MSMRIWFAFAASLILEGALCAETADKKQVVETIIQAEARGEQLLRHAVGTAVVKKSLVIREHPSKAGKPRLRSPDEGEQTFFVDFKLDGARQRLSRYNCDPATGSRGARKDELLDDGETYWAYVASANVAEHKEVARSAYRSLGDSFRLEAFNARGMGKFASSLRNGLEYSDYWEASLREDGMFVIRCGTREIRPDMPKCEIELVLNPAANYFVVESTKTSDWGAGDVRTAKDKVDWEQVGDTWVPKRLFHHVNWNHAPDDPTVAGDSESQCEIEIVNVDLVTDVPDSVFSIDDFGMAPGAEIVDVVAGVIYKYQAAHAEEKVLEAVSRDISSDLAVVAPTHEAPSPPEAPAAPPAAVETVSADIPEDAPTDTTPAAVSDESGVPVRGIILFSLAALAVAASAVLIVRLRRSGSSRQGQS